MKSLNNIRFKNTDIDLDKIKDELVESINEFENNDIPEYLDEEEFMDFINEGIGLQMAKNLLPKKILHKIKRAAHGNNYKMALQYYRKLKKDKSRKLTDSDMIRISASVAGISNREFLKVLNRETRYESNQNGQHYVKPSVKDTGKVLEDGLPETTKAYAAMVPGQDYNTIMNIISEEAPPDEEIEKWIKKNKKRFIDKYGKEDYGSYLYGKAWNMYNAKNECKKKPKSLKQIRNGE